MSYESGRNAHMGELCPVMSSLSRRAFVGLLVLCVWLVVGQTTAEASGSLVSSEPGNGETVSRLDRLELRFDRPVDVAASHVSLQSETMPVPLGQPMPLEGDPTGLSVAVPSIPPGRYRIAYHALALDGTPIVGVIDATLGQGAGAGAGSLSVAGYVAAIAVALLLGRLAASRLVRVRSPRQRLRKVRRGIGFAETARPPLAVAVTVLLVASVAAAVSATPSNSPVGVSASRGVADAEGASPGGTSVPPGVAAIAAAEAGEPLGDGTVLAPFETTRDGVKVFRLILDETTIEVSPGVVKQAYAFNGVVPGPVLRVNEGDRVRFVVTNELPVATAVHWHGMILPYDQDGVPGITQPAIEPGDTFEYEWTAVATGTHWYHTHSSGRLIGKGLYGPLEVVPKLADIAADRDYRVMLGDTDLGFTLNGRSFPSTAQLAARVGETVRLRVINAGDQVHAMHLHGTPFRVAAQDGIARLLPEGMDTVTVSPGQTYDLVAVMPSVGPWLFHCHIFGHSHMPNDEPGAEHSGMNGMVTIINVSPAAGPLETLPTTAPG